MEWKKGYLDAVLVPMGLLCSILYHCWLWRKIRRQPHQTVIGVNSAGRRLWVLAMIKDNEKKNILAVQTIRNAIMGSTLMATTSILLCTGLAAVLSSTYSVKKPLGDTVYGAHGEIMISVKYVTLLVIFLFSFFCYSLSIRFINQANFLINVPRAGDATAGADGDSFGAVAVTPDYVAGLLDRAFVVNTVGNRLFYAALPLLPWIFGPVLVLVCSVSIIPILYQLDVVRGSDGKSAGCCGKKEKVGSMEEA